MYNLCVPGIARSYRTDGRLTEGCVALTAGSDTILVTEKDFECLVEYTDWCEAQADRENDAAYEAQGQW